MVEESGELKIRGLASTTDLDRAGDLIPAEAWSNGGLDNYLKNPIVLFNHNYNKPIGRALKVTPSGRGLEFEAVISSAFGEIYSLIKDGVLGAFSVGFRIKDADIVEETGGLRIKDAELFEVSVVSVPCNQAATFSIAKSFESETQYQDFVNSFTNSATLAGQSLAKGEENSSNVASDAPEGDKFANSEKKMDPKEVDLEAFAQTVAEKAAADVTASLAMQRAKEKAAAEAEAKKAQEEEEARKAAEQVITKSLESGTEKLVADFQAKINERDAKFDEALKQFKEDLKAKEEELKQLRESKRVFSQNSSDSKKAVQDNAKELAYAHVFNTITNKGWDNPYSSEILEKAGVDYTARAADIDQEVASFIEKEVMHDLKAARLFREVPVNSFATVLPLQLDTNMAVWAKNNAVENFSSLENREDSPTSETYEPGQVILKAYRLISTTFMDNEVDEQVLINLMPMLVDGIARSHARAVENAILNGNGASMDGLTNIAETIAAGSQLSIGSSDKLTADDLLLARQGMGKYGMDPMSVVYIVSQQGYYDLLNDAKFQTLEEVGSDLAVRVTGTIGALYGSAVITSDEFPAITPGAEAAYVVNTRNFVIPRLRGVRVEQDYEVKEQRRVIVGSQNLGFNQLFTPNTGHAAAVSVPYKA